MSSILISEQLYSAEKDNQQVSDICKKGGKSFVAIGNLRTTTKFTTTTSVDWEKTGTRTSVSAGKSKLKMQSGR